MGEEDLKEFEQHVYRAEYSVGEKSMYSFVSWVLFCLVRLTDILRVILFQISASCEIIIKFS